MPNPIDLAQWKTLEQLPATVMASNLSAITLKPASIREGMRVSVKRSSFGATTGTIYHDLPDEYLAERTAAGFGDYLSPDGQIDASTCLFPESTWFIKGSSHSNWSDWELRLLYDIASSKEAVTVENSCWPSRFVTYTYTNPDEASDGEIAVMTADNCNTEHWEADEETDRPDGFFAKLRVAFTAWFQWLKALFNKLFDRG